MTPPTPLTRHTEFEPASSREALASGVSWPAVFAGAAVTAALSLVMLSLGAGLGLSTVSPWSHTAAENNALSAAAIVWLILNEIISSAMGGYLAGRLRTKWSAIHTDEVYFRDTAHGFLVWATAVIFTAASLAGAATYMVGGAETGAMSSTGNASASGPNTEYYVDSLFRGGNAQQSPADTFLYGEADRIFSRDLATRTLPDADRSYLAQQIAGKTGINPADANTRVTETFNQAQVSMDAARKASAHMLLWLFIALLVGAFSASYAATIGGRQRDHIQAI